MARSRRGVLGDLVSLRRSIDVIQVDLARFDRDLDETLVTLRRDHVARILTRFIEGSFSGIVVEQWADALEVRDDVEFEPSSDDVVLEAVHFLANPTLHGPLTAATAKEWLRRLGSG